MSNKALTILIAFFGLNTIHPTNNSKILPWERDLTIPTTQKDVETFFNPHKLNAFLAQVNLTELLNEGNGKTSPKSFPSPAIFTPNSSSENDLQLLETPCPGTKLTDTHAIQKINVPYQNSQPAGKASKYQHPICAKSFPTPAKLERHSVTHAKKRWKSDRFSSGSTFECPDSDCKKVSNRFSKLALHLCVHTKQKPFSCPICSTGETPALFTHPDPCLSHIKKKHHPTPKEFQQAKGFVVQQRNAYYDKIASFIKPTQEE
jgi:hypothetical protein